MTKWLKIPLFAAALVLASYTEGYALRQKPDQKKPANQDKKEEPQGDKEPNLDGVVEVSFKIDAAGKVQIVNLNSTSPQLSDYVMKKLSRIQLDQGGGEAGKVIKYRFVFKKQA